MSFLNLINIAMLNLGRIEMANYFLLLTQRLIYSPGGGFGLLSWLGRET